MECIQESKIQSCLKIKIWTPKAQRSQHVLSSCLAPNTSPQTIYAMAEHLQAKARTSHHPASSSPTFRETPPPTSLPHCFHTFYLSAGSLDVPTGYPPQSLEPARGSILYPGRTVLLHSYRTSGSPHLSGWTHSQPTSPNPGHGFLSTAGGLRRERPSEDAVGQAEDASDSHTQGAAPCPVPLRFLSPYLAPHLPYFVR